MQTLEGHPVLVAIVGPTATGKSALAIELAQHLDGEVISCDSTAVYRGFDIGTDKVPPAERQGIPHHLVDVAEPTDVYSAARYAADAARVVREITARGRLPVVAGGTGLYYRALTRGIFPGPGRDPGLRERLSRVAERRGVVSLHRWLQRCDPESARRIQPRDEKRLIRALEVYLVTGEPLTTHFSRTRSPVADYRVVLLGLRLTPEQLQPRIARRVDQQFADGLLDEIRALRARGVPAEAGPFWGLVYRQAVEHLAGARDEPASRALIVRENRRYARRQLIWFKQEPDDRWLETPGERTETHRAALGALAEAGIEVSHDVEYP